MSYATNPLLCETPSCEVPLVKVWELPCLVDGLVRLMCVCKQGHHQVRAYILDNEKRRQEAVYLLKHFTKEQAMTTETMSDLPPLHPLDHVLVAVPEGSHEVYQRMARIFGECLELSLRKGRDYGRDSDPYANVRRVEQVGLPTWAGIFIRLGDKLSRIEAAFTQQVTQGKYEMANESLDDAFRDALNYCAIALVTMEQDREKGDNGGR